jgi:hypothetical protein
MFQNPLSGSSIRYLRNLKKNMRSIILLTNNWLIYQEMPPFQVIKWWERNRFRWYPNILSLISISTIRMNIFQR